MEQIDVHDLLEDEAQLIVAFVELLRRRRREPQRADEEAPVLGCGTSASKSRSRGGKSMKAAERSLLQKAEAR